MSAGKLPQHHIIIKYPRDRNLDPDIELLERVFFASLNGILIILYLNKNDYKCKGISANPEYAER